MALERRVDEGICCCLKVADSVVERLLALGCRVLVTVEGSYFLSDSSRNLGLSELVGQEFFVLYHRVPDISTCGSDISK